MYRKTRLVHKIPEIGRSPRIGRRDRRKSFSPITMFGHRRAPVERWTLKELLTGRYRLHIQFGGRPFWCMFDYAAAPTQGSEAVEIVLADGADLVSAIWFPPLKS